MGFIENLNELKNIKNVKQVTLLKNEKVFATIPNAEGKKGSLKVYSNLINFKDGIIDAKKANKGLDIFAEYVKDAKNTPGSHPNIDYLLDVIETGKEIKVKIKLYPWYN